jgi:ATP-dependent protease ClpP protease subunit
MVFSKFEQRSGKSPGIYSMKAGSKDSVQILLYDDIGKYFGGVTHEQFSRDLKSFGSGIKTINLRINSDGGDVWDAVGIHNALREHGARIVVDIDAMAASSASFIAMAGDEINIAENAFMMIHESWTIVAANKRQLRKQADHMEQIDSIIASHYVARTKNDFSQVNAWMEEEFWMNAEKAKQLRFADNITQTLNIAARLDVSRFQNVPQSVIDMILPKELPPNYDAPKLAARKANLARLDMARLRASRRI